MRQKLKTDIVFIYLKIVVEKKQKTRREFHKRNVQKGKLLASA